MWISKHLQIIDEPFQMEFEDLKKKINLLIFEMLRLGKR
jgi:hypothetical protein